MCILPSYIKRISMMFYNSCQKSAQLVRRQEGVSTYYDVHVLECKFMLVKQNIKTL